ncbi:MAG: diaminopimelate epimerase [Gammaproteobacteria bacterium]
MRLEFTKMHGLGNDFVVIDAWAGQPVPSVARIREIADRHFGVGCDQVLVIDPPPGPQADIGYRIFNADGSRAGQCGNGIRCVARFLVDRGRLRGQGLRADTGERILTAFVEADGEVRVDMGRPRFAPAEVPMRACSQAPEYEIEALGARYRFGAASMGNPHAVLVVPDVDTAPVATLGPVIEHHPMFPERANVGFLQVQDRTRVRLRVFERGAGETLACGTGACAAVAVGRVQGRLDPQVEVHVPGGRLRIRWEGGEAPVWMTGPAAYVFEGVIEA